MIISEHEKQPYVRFYEHEKPGVSAEVRERIVREESKRQSRALLEQLIHKAFSNDEQIDDTEYFNLKLTSDAAGYTEDELDQLIGSTSSHGGWMRIMKWLLFQDQTKSGGIRGGGTILV